MKKVYYIAFICMNLLSSCISSEFVGVEATSRIDNKNIEGTWIPTPNQKSNVSSLPIKIIIKKNIQKGEYSTEIILREQNANQEKQSFPTTLFLGEAQNMTYFSIKMKNKAAKKGEIDTQFSNGIYTVKDSILTFQLMVEKDANKVDTKDIGQIKPTKFANPKALQDFVKTHLTLQEYLSDEIIYKRSNKK